MTNTNDPYIAALLRERDGYANAGLTDRVKLVDEELARQGYEDDDAGRSTAPRGRRTKPVQTTEGEDQPARRPGRPRKQEGDE